MNAGKSPFWPALLLFLGVWLIPASSAHAQFQWRLVTTKGPPPRGDSFLAYDTDRKKAVCFGGFRQIVNYDYNDTWEWDGNRWSKIIVPLPLPANRCGAGAMAYDQLHHVCLLESGLGILPKNDTWTFDGVGWNKLAGMTPIVGNCNSLSYDSGNQVVVEYGGALLSDGNLSTTTWLHDASGWHGINANPTPAGREFPGLTYDSGRQKTVLFGGRIDYQDQSQPSTFFNDTWEWDGSAWTQINIPGPGFRNCGGMMVYDPILGQTVLWGGAGISFIGRIDTWTYDGTTWTDLAINSPTYRYTAMWFDEIRGKVMMYGGSDELLHDFNSTFELGDGTPVPTTTPTPTTDPTPTTIPGLPTYTPLPSPSRTPTQVPTPTGAPTSTGTPTATATPLCEQGRMALDGIPCYQTLSACVPLYFTLHDGNAGGPQASALSVVLNAFPIPVTTRVLDASDLQASFLPNAVTSVEDNVLVVTYTTNCGTISQNCKLYFTPGQTGVEVGGYLTTSLTTALGGLLQLEVLASVTQGCSAPSQAKLYYEGIDTGVRLQETGTSGVYTWSAPIYSGIPQTSLTFSVILDGAGGSTGTWPYLTVN